MADTPENAVENNAPPPPITINAQYIKDLSFEAPAAPGIFQIMQQKQPDINVTVNVEANGFDKNVFEIILSISAHATVDDDTAFLLELDYAGVFTLNAEPEHIHPLAYIECPRLLFPFARAILANATREGGFPPLMLGTVDFVAMFQREMQNQQAAAAADNADGDKTTIDV
ncbi:MAG: protein-export chaperone SecB [Rhodospirillales bacterium]|nr:protein-export chaperone SecB [Rhodospirillales bacterium]